MVVESKNSSLGKARDAKQDEFYTQLSDIEKELKHYRKYFKGMLISLKNIFFFLSEFGSTLQIAED